MKLYLTDGRHWTGTQADAKAAGEQFVAVEIPTDKPGLLATMQKFQDKITELRMKSGEAAVAETSAGAVEERSPLPVDTEEPASVTTPASPPPQRDLVAEVSALDGNKLMGVLSAAVARLSETAGVHGWAAFTKNVYAWTPSARSVEHGIGMMMLAAFNHFGEEKKS